MKYAAILVATSAAIASAQFTINSTGTIICTGDPNGAFCAGDSLGGNFIVRCTNGIGQAGNCNDNTAGYFPFGDDGGSLCWQTSNTTGDAACEKNCIVECSTGNCGESFTLSDCTPSATQTSSTASSTATTSSTSSPVSITTSATTTPTSNLTITSTGTSICTTGGTTTTITFTTTYCPESTLSTSIVAPTSVATSGPAPVSSTYILSTGTGTGSTSTAASNGTATTTTKSGSATPVGPSSTTSATPSTYTGAAMRDSAGAGLAAVGLFIAYFL